MSTPTPRGTELQISTDSAFSEIINTSTTEYRTSESFRLQSPLFVKVFEGYAIGLSLRLSP